MIQKQLAAIVIVLCGYILVEKHVEGQTARLEPPRLESSQLTRNPLRGQRYAPSAELGSLTPVVVREPRTALSVSRVAQQNKVTPVRSAPRRSYSDIYRRNSRGVSYSQPVMQSQSIIEEEYIEHDTNHIADLACGDCGQCDVCQIHCPPYQLISFADMEYSVGIQGFKGVPNLGRSGSFGFNQGINWGFPVPLLPLLDLSGQIGVRFTQANMYGDNFTSENRDQTFLTAGISRRVDYGLQMGIVVDYLDDQWYYEGSFTQLRTELAMVGECGNQFGFRFTSDMKDSPTEVAAGLAGFPTIDGVTNFSANDTYRFFYRQSWDQIRGGYAEGFAGFTEGSQGLVGTDFLIPIAERWALTADFTFLIPSSSTTLSSIDEGWNIGMGLTWYPKGLSTWSKLYHRPLMDVADNGTFMFKR